MSTRIVHISDPHFGTIKPAAMEALLLALKILNPQAIVLSGDITQRARRDQFEQARIFKNTFEGLPFLVMPGNHDIPMYNLFGRFFHPYFGFKNILKGKLNQEIEVGQTEILALNSTRRSRAIQGVIDTDFLKRRMSQKKKRSIRMAVFHHPLECPKYVDEKNLLINREEVVPILAEGEVDIVLGGHIHDPITCLSVHRYPKVKRQMIIGVAGTCLSTRTRADANNSFNVIDVNADTEVPKMTVSRFDLIEDRIFEATESHRFIRNSPDGGWSAN